MDYDVVIVGAGPAGLSAALVLGRCRRRVLVCDGGPPRNAGSEALHGFLSRDGIAPSELLRISREQLGVYPGVTIREVEVTDARRLDGGGYAVELGDGTRLRARKLLLATGMADDWPAIEGAEAFYARSIFHCPYCDGWEMRDEPLAIYGKGKEGMRLALELTGWTGDLVLCTDGPAGLSSAERDRLARHGIGVEEKRIARLEGAGGVLERIVFEDGTALPRRGLFFVSHPRQRSDLPERLGCEFTEQRAVDTDAYELTSVDDLYVAGDASRAVQLAIVAASEGAKAAFAINTALLKEQAT